jgi:hypothetical protein
MASQIIGRQDQLTSKLRQRRPPAKRSQQTTGLTHPGGGAKVFNRTLVPKRFNFAVSTIRFDERYEQILHASALTFAEKGFAAASIRDLSHATRLSLAGLYYSQPGAPRARSAQRAAKANPNGKSPAKGP